MSGSLFKAVLNTGQCFLYHTLPNNSSFFTNDQVFVSKNDLDHLSQILPEFAKFELNFDHDFSLKANPFIHSESYLKLGHGKVMYLP